jgi:hypothetical protein
VKTRPATCQTKAFTRTELFVVIGVIAVPIVVLTAVLLSGFSMLKNKARIIHCVKNVSDIGTAFKVWEGGNNDKVPMYFAATNSETMKLIGSGHAYVLWQMMSNEFRSPESLYCPADTYGCPATRAFP